MRGLILFIRPGSHHPPFNPADAPTLSTRRSIRSSAGATHRLRHLALLEDQMQRFHLDLQIARSVA
ncbi:hypothetical protein [Reticulibacter mediterranei]|uniref:hypothetical protein n=1 Tax=Reticulibacter mediterranei TaxID=2778369 RepID=UPI001C68D67F|nr:hypothetical protein [Reticulibacter mediterranei]